MTLWLLALALLCIAFGTVSTALLMQGADDIGPAVTEVIARRGARSDQDPVRDLIHDLAGRVVANRRAPDHKEPRLTAGLVLTLLAILIELVGQIQ